METPAIIALILGSIMILVFIIIFTYKIYSYVVSSSKLKILIKLDKYEFKPGEIIEGIVYLKIKKSLKSKEINIRFHGQKEVSDYNQINKRYERRVNEIFDFKKPLIGEKEFLVGEYEYKFSINIPRDILSTNILEKTGTKIINTMKAISGENTRTRWYLEANFKGENLVNLGTEVDINLV